MNKKAGVEVIIIVAVVVTAAIILAFLFLHPSLNGKNSPFLETIQISPPAIISGSSSSTSNQATLSFEVNNPTVVDFSGKVEFVYDTDCLDTYYVTKNVFAQSQRKQAFSQIFNIKNSGYSSLPDKCFQQQSIFLKLEDSNNSRIYDTQEVKISITHP